MDLARDATLIPQSTNSQASSVSVHAVTSAVNAKQIHSSRSRPTVVRTSFTALRATIAITAAPMP